MGARERIGMSIYEVLEVRFHSPIRPRDLERRA
jgi:hypothetical protein